MELQVLWRNKTISVGNLPCPTVIHDIIDLYKDVGQVVHVRLVTDCEGKQNGMGYIEFASAKEAEKVNRSDLNYYYFFKV